MANYSKEELQYIASQVQPYLLELVKANGLDVDTIEVVEDTDGITSLPAYDNRGGTKKVVRVPLGIFSKPAEDAAATLDEYIAKANEATTNANTAADSANAASEEINVLKPSIEQSLSDTEQAVGEVNTALEEIESIKDELENAEAEREQAENERVSAEDSRVASEELRTAEYATLKGNMEASIVAMDKATEDAQDTADHPTYIGEDNYVYVWNKEAKAYDKTSIYVRGEGFSISRTYTSMDEMEADTGHGLKEGDFVLINTNDVENPDNAKIYVVDANGDFVFLVDMSGAVGFTGKTPQFSIGTVSVGANRADAGVSVSDDGYDESGNPKYKLNLRIPSIQLSDLSESEIELLQSPANDMIARLEETERQVFESEDLRKEAELQRVASEEARSLEEQVRNENESLRKEAENERIVNEEQRKVNESERSANEESRKKSEEERLADYESLRADMLQATQNANDAAEETRNTPIIKDGTWWLWNMDTDTYVDSGTPAKGRSPMIQNGTWWTWNDDLGQYVDSGQSVSSGYILTKEKIEGVFTGDITTHTHSHLRYSAQVYREMPDLSSLTKYTDSMGEHEYLVGNDIYVADAGEPTGFANYKLAYSESGNVWVKVAQIPQGYKTVIVKES